VPSVNFFQYLTIVMIWGSTWLVVKLQVGMPIPSEVSLALRFGSAGLILLGLCAIHGHRLRFSLRQHAWLFLQGALLTGINYIIHYESARHLTSGVSAVIFASILIFNLFLSALFFGDRITLPRVLGSVIGMSGICLVFAQELAAVDLNRSWAVGAALVATFIASLGMMVSVRNQRAGFPIVSGNAWGMLYGGLLVGAIGWAKGYQFPTAWTPGYFFSLFYLAVFGSIVTFTFYLSLQRKIGTLSVSYVNLICPMIALAISTFYEGYQWTPTAVGGVVAILAGNLLILNSQPRPRMEHEELVERLATLASESTQRRA
jgi:drug/metabolite transporter (DMT)-like permease